MPYRWLFVMHPDFPYYVHWESICTLPMLTRMSWQHVSKNKHEVNAIQRCCCKEIMSYLFKMYKHVNCKKYETCAFLYFSYFLHFTLRSNTVSKEAKIRNRYNQVPHLTQNTTRESDKNTIKHHTQESQEVSPFPAGDHKAEMSRQESRANTKHK